MLAAEKVAANLNCRGLSLIVSDAKSGALRLYKRLGYCEVAERPMIKEGWVNDGDYRALMVKFRNAALKIRVSVVRLIRIALGRSSPLWGALRAS